MTGAFAFLILRSLKNRVLTRLRRLRKLPYLISVLAGLVYLGFIFLYPYYGGVSRPPQGSLLPDGGGMPIAESGFALLLSAAFALQIYRTRAESPVFSEAEVQWLFPAPVSRKALIHYHAARSQAGILFGVLISVLIFGRGLTFHRAGLLFAALWALYSLLYLGRVAVIFAKRSLKERGVPEWKTRSWTIGALLVFAGSTLWWIRNHIPSPSMHGEVAWNILDWLMQVSGSGPVYWATFPFRLAVRPIFAAETARFGFDFVVVGIMMLLLYVMILLSRVDLAGAVGVRPAEAAGLGSIRKERDTKVLRGGRPRHPPFRLNPAGPAFVALYWKNLMITGGFTTGKVRAGLLALAAVLILIQPASGGRAGLIVGSVAVSLAGFLALMGPIIFREDLRTDLKNIDMLKTYPIPGWGVVLGEALAPTTVLTALEWALVLIAVFLLPGSEESPWGARERIVAALSALPILPWVSLIGVLIQNAAALLLPGWMALDREHERGVEAMGQRLIASIAGVLLLLVAGLPAGIAFAAVYFAGFGVIGPSILPMASLAAALTLGAVAGFGILWLGRLFDRLDPAEL